jgi:hypothetical protein
MILESRATSCSGHFSFEGQAMSLRALYEHFPCFQIIFSSNSNAGFTLLGVFDARAFFGLHLNGRMQQWDLLDPHLYLFFSIGKIRILMGLDGSGEHSCKTIFARKDIFR